MIEALARFRWSKPVPWNITTAGRLFERLRQRYPADPQARSLMQADLSQQTAGGGPASSSLEFRTGPEQMIFSVPDGNRLLIVGPQDVSVHGLVPYEGWEVLERRLFEGLELIQDFVPEDARVEQVGLRYINRVEIPTAPIELNEYLTIGFTLPPSFPQELVGFLDRLEVVYPNEPIRLAFTWASTDSSDGTSAFLLDFDLIASPLSPLTLEDARQTLSDLKLKENAAFEGLLQDKLREEVFREIRE